MHTPTSFSTPFHKTLPLRPSTLTRYCPLSCSLLAAPRVKTIRFDRWCVQGDLQALKGGVTSLALLTLILGSPLARVTDLSSRVAPQWGPVKSAP